MQRHDTTRTTIALAVIVAAAVTLGAAPGCGGGKAARVNPLEKAAVGEVVHFEGTLSLRGSQPVPILVLELDDDAVVRVASKTLQGELESLSGMPVAIEGDVMPPMDKTPVVNVTRYEMLRLPSGELPVVGVITNVGDNLILTERDGKRHWIRGSLVSILREYGGARIWVVGSAGHEGLTVEPKGAMSYWVTGYGILSQPQ
jgi:hypothetical protein